MNFFHNTLLNFDVNGSTFQARVTIVTSLSTIINQVSCYQIMKVLPKHLMLSGWKKFVLCIRTHDVSYLCMLYIKLGLLQDGEVKH